MPSHRIVMKICIAICASKALAVFYCADVFSLLLGWELLKGRKGITACLGL